MSHDGTAVARREDRDAAPTADAAESATETHASCPVAVPAAPPTAQSAPVPAPESSPASAPSRIHPVAGVPRQDRLRIKEMRLRELLEERVQRDSLISTALAGRRPGVPGERNGWRDGGEGARGITETETEPESAGRDGPERGEVGGEERDPPFAGRPASGERRDAVADEIPSDSSLDDDPDLMTRRERRVAALWHRLGDAMAREERLARLLLDDSESAARSTTAALSGEGRETATALAVGEIGIDAPDTENADDVMSAVAARLRQAKRQRVRPALIRKAAQLEHYRVCETGNGVADGPGRKRPRWDPARPPPTPPARWLNGRSADDRLAAKERKAAGRQLKRARTTRGESSSSSSERTTPQPSPPLIDSSPVCSPLRRERGPCANGDGSPLASRAADRSAGSERSPASRYSCFPAGGVRNRDRGHDDGRENGNGNRSDEDSDSFDENDEFGEDDGYDILPRTPSRSSARSPVRRSSGSCSPSVAAAAMRPGRAPCDSVRKPWQRAAVSGEAARRGRPAVRLPSFMSQDLGRVRVVCGPRGELETRFD